jgi:hypothetical protein
LDYPAEISACFLADSESQSQRIGPQNRAINAVIPIAYRPLSAEYDAMHDAARKEREKARDQERIRKKPALCAAAPRAATR